MLRFHELPPSPNNLKIRLALRAKGIPFEVEEVDPFQRERLVQRSGQELSPVIEDKGIVLHDSEAILHYLDANYPDTLRLYPADREGRKTCDAWKDTLDRKLARAWAPVFFKAIGMREEMAEEAPERYREALSWLEDELGERESFGGTQAPVMDLRAAVWSCYAFPGEKLVQRAPFFAGMDALCSADPAKYPRLVRGLEPWFARLA